MTLGGYNMKTEKLLLMKQLFEKHTILLMSEICNCFANTKMRTIIRYLNEIGYYSSYNYAGKYYTIYGIPSFDEHGLWGYKEALFSLYGNLKNTILVQLNKSEAGMTNDELTSLLHVNTKNALTDLALSNAVARYKNHGAYVYYNIEPICRKQQQTNRAALDTTSLKNILFDPYDIVEVLSAYIKGIKTPEQVTSHIRYKKHAINYTTVVAIFKSFELDYDADGKKNIF